MGIYKEMEAEKAALEDENTALKRTVEDLAHALRKANAACETQGATATARAIRSALERHGLLRDVDRPEMTKVFREEMAAERASDEAARAGTYEEPCQDCGANAYEPCTPDCQDRR